MSGDHNLTCTNKLESIRKEMTILGERGTIVGRAIGRGAVSGM